VSGGPRRITVPNFVKIGRSIAEILRFFKLSTWLQPPSRIFKITIFWPIGVQRVETYQLAKFCHNRSIRCENIKIFRFCKNAAIRHLGFVWGIF